MTEVNLIDARHGTNRHARAIGCMVVAGEAYIKVRLTFLLTALHTCAAHHSFRIWDVI